MYRAHTPNVEHGMMSSGVAVLPLAAESRQCATSPRTADAQTVSASRRPRTEAAATTASLDMETDSHYSDGNRFPSRRDGRQHAGVARRVGVRAPRPRTLSGGARAVTARRRERLWSGPRSTHEKGVMRSETIDTADSDAMMGPACRVVAREPLAGTSQGGQGARAPRRVRPDADPTAVPV